VARIRSQAHGVRRVLATSLATAAVLLTALPAGAGATPAASGGRTATTTFDPIGGGYNPVSLMAFGANVARNASPPTVDILVSPAAYGTKPTIKDNWALAKERAQMIQHACNQAVQGSGLTCVATAVRMFLRKDSYSPALIKAIEDPSLDGIYFLGGNQDIAMKVLGDTPAEAAMAGAYARGVVIGGTSAGDNLESATMLAGFNHGYDTSTALQEAAPLIWWPGGTHHEHGLSFGSTNAVFDAHFYERGRLPRLLNTIAQTADRFGGAGALGFGFDYGTGARVENDRTLTGVFGASSSLAVIDLKTAGATHQWTGNDRTLSVRNALTQIMAPGTGVTLDMDSREVSVNGSPVPYRAPGAWPAGLLAAPGRGPLLLGGDLSHRLPSPAMNRFVTLAQASGRTTIQLVTAAYVNQEAAREDARRYIEDLRASGWTGAIDRALFPQNPLPDPTAAAGVLISGGDPSLLKAALTPALETYLSGAINASPVVLTDQAMTQAMGGAYAANPNVTPDHEGAAGMHRFRTGNARVSDGLGYLPGAMFVPRLAEDERWGQLYGLTIRRPSLLSFGIEEGTAIELRPAGGASVVGSLSVVVVDGRTATWMPGSNGAFTDLNVLLHAFAPGDRLQSPA
jgi:cyanophycinase-like exopeptidase